MTPKKRITYLVSAIFLLLFTFGCNEIDVTITKDYVINPYWDEVDNSFTITKMIFKDANDTLNLKNVSPSELLGKLIEDSSFSFITNIKYNGEDYSKRKVYFNRNNGSSWSKLNARNSNYLQEILGELKQNTWYYLGGLDKEATLYYIYLDNNNNLHTFKVSAQHWTNY